MYCNHILRRAAWNIRKICVSRQEFPQNAVFLLKALLLSTHKPRIFRQRPCLTATQLPRLSPAAKAAPRGRCREASLRGSAAAEPPQAQFRLRRNCAAPARGSTIPCTAPFRRRREGSTLQKARNGRSAPHKH